VGTVLLHWITVQEQPVEAQQPLRDKLFACP